LPINYRRGLDALDVNYPGCERDLVIAREAIEMGLKKDFLRVFRRLKGRQIVHDHCKNMKSSNNMTISGLKYPGNEADKRELQNWFNENPPSEKNIKIFQERVEGLRNKDAAIGGDRSHPNIAALLKLKLTYPGCEEDVQEALQVHYSRPLTLFPDVLHSLKAKQDEHVRDRSHWRLVKLDDLELTYPRWKKDFEAVEDWHIHNEDNGDNDVLFHEIIEGMLEKEDLYLEWILERKHRQDKDEQPLENNSNSVEYRDHNNDIDARSDDVQQDEFEADVSSFDKYYVVGREDQHQKQGRHKTLDLGLRSNGSLLDWDEEEREPEFDGERL